MYLVKTPQVVQNLFPHFTWRIPTREKVLFLTFDDGPIPEVTPWVLDQLQAFDACATFFCVGENASNQPELFARLRREGHAVGSHTYQHLNGWQTDNRTYFLNTRRAAQRIGGELFRPPYGKLKPSQAQFLQRHYRIVMWDVLSADFDPAVRPQQCLNYVLERSEPGSIVVFHDSLKAWPRLEYALPRVLEHFSEQGYRFQPLSEQRAPVRKTA